MGRSWLNFLHQASQTGVLLATLLSFLSNCPRPCSRIAGRPSGTSEVLAGVSCQWPSAKLPLEVYPGSGTWSFLPRLRRHF